MKFSTFILATFILFLAAKPGIDSLLLHAVTHKSCCALQSTSTCDNDTSNHQTQDNDCEATFCNPFQSCCCCVLICLRLSIQNTPLLTIFADKMSIYQSSIIVDFNSNIWQPPKNV